MTQMHALIPLLLVSKSILVVVVVPWLAPKVLFQLFFTKKLLGFIMLLKRTGFNK